MKKCLMFLPLFFMSAPCWALYDCTEFNGREHRRYQSSAPCDTTFPVARNRSLDGTIEIPMLGGHFRTNGLINGHPVSYMIDTGATFTSVSSRVAASLGISGCEVSGTTQTANGAVKTCVVTVPEISVGGLRVANVSVSIMPNMGDELLLGMNVLRRFTILQDGRTMRISSGR